MGTFLQHSQNGWLSKVAMKNQSIFQVVYKNMQSEPYKPSGSWLTLSEDDWGGQPLQCISVLLPFSEGDLLSPQEPTRPQIAPVLCAAGSLGLKDILPGTGLSSDKIWAAGCCFPERRSALDGWTTKIFHQVVGV